MKNKILLIIMVLVTQFLYSSTIIITIQKLLYIYKNNPSDFKKLSEWTGVVFYDEGHHEPSREWAEASRNLDAKTVLFTATPFRNDYGYFNTSDSYYYEYFIKEAIDKNHIKSPVFHKIPKDCLTDYNKIATFIAGKTEYKSIVRILGKEKIRTIKEQFEADVQVACCHSKFTLEEDYYNNGQAFLKNQSKYKIVLQTDMLSEGVDLPDFTELFLFDCYDNFKSFVQIVGRVLRKNNSRDKANIYIPEESFEKFTNQWKIYFERDSKSRYYNGKLLKEFNLCLTSNIHEEINFEKQANIYTSKTEVFDILKDAIIKKVRNSVELEDNTIKIECITHNVTDLYVACYSALKPSAHLSNKFIVDKKFEYISLVRIKRETDTYYFYYSTQRLYPFEEISGITNVSMKEMYKLFPEDADVKNVSFRSSLANRIGVNDYSYSGNSLNVLPSSTEQRMSFFKSALAVCDEGGNIVNRYISSFSSKITDRYQSCNYSEYISWCNSLLNIIESKEKNSYFGRFAPITEAPSGSITYIAFDEPSSNFDFEDCDAFRKIYSVENNEFFIELDSSAKIKGVIAEFDGTKCVSFVIDGVSHPFIDKNIHFLNQNLKKGFILYYTKIKEPIIYSNGNYYKPNIKYNYKFVEQCELLNIMEPLDGLTDCDNEKKGTVTIDEFKEKGFPSDSIFGVTIEELKKNFNYIVCDDLQCEIADFIAIDHKTPKICFIHCKHGKNNLSASDFHDVCGQAIKNLNYVISADISQTDFIENHFNKWKKDWESGDHKTSRVINGDISKFITYYKKIIGDLDVKKEVWIVTTGLSMKAFRKELVKKEHAEQYVPLMNILHYTQDNIVKAGAALKIFCKK